MNNIIKAAIAFGVVAAAYLLTSPHRCHPAKNYVQAREIFRSAGMEQGDLFLLFGGSLCATCPAGEYVRKSALDSQIVYVVPEEFSPNDIDNLRHSYDLKGTIMRGGAETRKLIQEVSACRRSNVNQKNYRISFHPGGTREIVEF